MSRKYYYQKTVKNTYLGKSTIIKAATSWELDNKVKDKLSMWAKQEAVARKREHVNNKKEEAELLTQEALDNIEDYKSILLDSINRKSELDWNLQKRKFKFEEYKFDSPDHMLAQAKELEVKKSTLSKVSFIEYILKSKKITREEELQKTTKDLNEILNKVENENKKQQEDYRVRKDAAKAEVDKHNLEIDSWKNNYEKGIKDDVEKFVELILSSTPCIENYNNDFELEYDEDHKRLIVDIKLPSIDDIPSIIEYKYIKTKNEISVKYMKKKELELFYDDIIFQIVLRTLNEIFIRDYANSIELVVLNGIVEYVDKAIGVDKEAIIISLQVSREKFNTINLERIDYRECVQSLKGIFAKNLYTLTPVKPYLQLNRDDSRLRDDRDVLLEYSNENLAVMPWEDFEHLVRELFSKMFSKDGAEVKVTQASRDGGVDAIAFDPDPIRGGKFIIQAKRYNMTVPVSAVRDLYGTVQHEGATRGILVTTSNFGNDSYAFAQGKSLTLINGQELLSLLQDHGYGEYNIILNKK